MLPRACSGYTSIRDFTTSIVVPHVLALREFILRAIVSQVTGQNHVQLAKSAPIVDVRSFLRAALCDGLPFALDNAPYSPDADSADLSITVQLHAEEGDRVVRQFVKVVRHS